jgi:glutamate carboxypeptidase
MRSDPNPLEIAVAVRERMASQLGVLLEDIRDLVERDSPSYEVDLLDATAASIVDMSHRLGLAGELLEGDGAGSYARTSLEGYGEHVVLLLCHHDTVFPRGTAASRPFSVEGDRMLGPGVVDMKGGIVQGLYVMAALAEFPDSYRRVDLLSVPDEEVRSGPPLYLDSQRYDLVLTLECGRANGDIVSSRKAGLWLELEVPGLAAHAGVDPDAGHNAAVAAAFTAVRISGLHRSLPGLSVTVTGLNSGVGMNTVPPDATIVVDVRAERDQDIETALARINPGDAFEFRTLARTPAMERTVETAALAQLAITTAAHLGRVGGDQATGGSSDACWVAKRGQAVLDGLGPVGGMDHTPEEYGLVSSLAPCGGVLAALVVEGPSLVATTRVRAE